MDEGPKIDFKALDAITLKVLAYKPKKKKKSTSQQKPKGAPLGRQEEV